MISLDKFQKEAAFCDNKKVLIVAPPGSGKTTVILNRLNYLINKKNISPFNVIVITFTKAAANNMKERFKENYNENKLPFFGTFHGLFYKILIRHKGEIKLISQKEAYGVVKKVLESILNEISEEKIKEVLNMISYYKCRKQIKDNSECSEEIFFKCYEEYEKYKERLNLLDFDDLQIQCRDLLYNNENILRGYRRLFKHILVDEFQDCDPIQIEILQLLNEDNSLFAVGDEDQCIYSFRGSNPQCMVDFNKLFLNGEKRYLKYNYRSSKNIVDLSSKVIENNKNRNKKEIISYKEDNGRFEIMYPYDENKEVEIISDIIKENIKSGDNYDDNVILYRTNIQSRGVIDGFIRNKIPFRLLDGEYNFYDHFICKDIISYLKLSIDPTDRESFFRIINKPFRYISKKSIEDIKGKKYKENLFEVLKNLESIHPYQIKSIDDLYKDIAYLNKMSLCGAVEFIINNLGYLEYIGDYCSRYKQDIESFKEIIEEFKSSALEFKSIITFLAHIDFIKEKLKESKNSKGNRVILSTIHGVKGMEFKNVFLIDVNEEIIPHKNSKEENQEEERRLYYVALTRAINNLYIYAPKNVRGTFRDKSTFLKETDYNKFFLKRDYGFKIEDKITHKVYGQGKIIYLENNEIKIKFEDGEERKFSLQTVIENKLVTKI